MGVRVYGGDDFEELVHKLGATAETTRQEGAGSQSLVGQWAMPVTVVVPGLEIGAYIEQTLSRQFGVAANFEFVTLENFLTPRIEKAAGERFEIL